MGMSCKQISGQQTQTAYAHPKQIQHALHWQSSQPLPCLELALSRLRQACVRVRKRACVCMYAGVCVYVRTRVYMCVCV